MRQPFHQTWQQARTGLLVMWLVGGCVLLLFVGCASKGNGVQPAEAEAQATWLQDDPADPTAIRLHDLAGKILLYQATKHSMPTKLEDFASTAAGGDGVDPATGQSFLYTPDSAMRSGLPGRVILHQPRANPERGRWALLMNDLASDGRVVTYVQRVPERLLPRATRR